MISRYNQGRPSEGHVATIKNHRQVGPIDISGIGVSGFQGHETLALRNRDMRILDTIIAVDPRDACSRI
jgi:hypothetical protein